MFNISADILEHIKKDYGEIQNIVQFHEALSNEVFLIETHKQSLVLKILRNTEVYAKDILISNYCAKENISPKLLFSSNKYYFIEYIAGGNLNNGLPILENHIVKQMASLVKHFHYAPLTIEPLHFQDLEGYYLNKIQELIINNSYFLNDIKNLMAKVFHTINTFENMMVVSHNDLNPSNFLLDSSKKLWLIDFEYAGYNDAYFDFAIIKNNLTKEQFQLFATEYGLKINNEKLHYYNILRVYIDLLWHFEYFLLYDDKKYLLLGQESVDKILNLLKNNI